MTELVNSVEDVGGVVLEDNDKKEILDFLLKRDVNGATEFQK
jgi:vacuolar-type H+-ATPase subunit E/Vma4